ncbi:MAG TPA: MFS transporter [Pseudonocardiaceae bacterium]|nr:MFS transporter [Pseudonocardiaceae bacterium]
MFSSLSERNYRLFAGGQVISNVGTWMQRVAQDWLVLQLSGHSPMALGIAAALQFAPTLLLSMWAGMLADRMDKRKLEIAVQAGMGVTALALGLLDVTGTAVLWQVYLLCLVLGCFSAMDSPIRQSFVMEMVGRRQLPNAVALNSMTFNLARIVGPAVAGLMINWVGTGWVFLINAASFAAVIAGLVAMDPKRLYTSAKLPRQRGQLMDAARYVRGRTDILVLLVLVFCVSTFGIVFFTTLANVAVNVFHRSATGYGLLSTMLAVGTLAGATLAARRSASARSGPPRLRVLITSGLVFGLLEILLAAMPTYTLFGLLLIPVGGAVLTFSTTANSVVQLSVSPEMRGRVMGLYMLVFLGGNPIAGPLTGWLAEEFGGRSPFLFGGLVSAVAALLCGWVLARRGGITVSGLVGSLRPASRLRVG